VRTKSETAKLDGVDEGPQRVLLIAATILAARKLAQFDGGLCQEDEKSSCCTEDEGGPFGAAL
jgi:hypothetical protein